MYIVYENYDTDAQGETYEELTASSKLLGEEIATDFLNNAVRSDVVNEIQRTKLFTRDCALIMKELNQKMRDPGMHQGNEIDRLRRFIYKYNMFQTILITLEINVDNTPDIILE